MKNLILFLFVLSLLSCTKDDEPCCGIVQVGADFSIINEKGEDLLNPTTPNYFPFEEIEVYYLENGVKTSAEDSEVNNSLGFDGKSLDTVTNPYRLSIRTYIPDSEIYDGQINEDGTETGTAITYVQLNKEDTDTIKTKWSQSVGKAFVTKLWYNGVLQEDRENFTITK